MQDTAFQTERFEGVPTFDKPPLSTQRPPRCPPYVDITHPDQLLPYLEHVAQRPYNHGLNACWDLKPGERVLLRVDNWHSDLVIVSAERLEWGTAQPAEEWTVPVEVRRIPGRRAEQRSAVEVPQSNGLLRLCAVFQRVKRIGRSATAPRS